MIINKQTRRFQTRSDCPNSCWLENVKDWYVLDDSSVLALKIRKNYPYIQLEIEDDKIVEVIIDTERKEKEGENRQKEQQIINLKRQLNKTDYQAIKYAEGQLSEEEYSEMKVQRQAWRDEINKLEEEINSLG